MKKICSTIIALLSCPAAALACDACEKQQPAFTRGITHGAGPTGGFDWVIVGAMVIVSLATLILSARYLFRPGEKERTHIKHSIHNQP